MNDWDLMSAQHIVLLLLLFLAVSPWAKWSSYAHCLMVLSKLCTPFIHEESVIVLKVIFCLVSEFSE